VVTTREPDATRYHPGGRSLTWVATIAAGRLRVQQDDQAIYVIDVEEPVAWMPCQRAVWLDGELILDPDRARALAAEAGLFTGERHDRRAAGTR
jgi:hypothetical protein